MSTVDWNTASSCAQGSVSPVAGANLKQSNSSATVSATQLNQVLNGSDGHGHLNGQTPAAELTNGNGPHPAGHVNGNGHVTLTTGHAASANGHAAPANGHAANSLSNVDAPALAEVLANGHAPSTNAHPVSNGQVVSNGQAVSNGKAVSNGHAEVRNGRNGGANHQIEMVAAKDIGDVPADTELDEEEEPDAEIEDEDESESAADRRASRIHDDETNKIRAFHRLSDVRRQQGVSQRNMARRLNTDLATIRHQEEETTDLALSVLYQWQKVLEVPVSELLVDSDAPLSAPVMERARMVKVMKTVAALVEKADSPSIKRLLQMLCEQLLEIMPELTDIAPWHAVGQRRTLDEFGRIVERQVPDDMFRRRAR